MLSVLDRLAGGLVVSCQAYPGEPLRDPDVMARMARAVVGGGAVGVRAQGLADLELMAGQLEVPLIGLVKVGTEGVFITPTLADALAVAAAGADVVAVDATDRERPDGGTFPEIVRGVHHRTGCLVMADVSTYEEGCRAAEAGADLVGTTLSGYTASSPTMAGPDLDLVARLSGAIEVPVVAEGRIHTTQEATAALAAGAHCVVVGTAITHPTSITRWFVEAIATEVP